VHGKDAAAEAVLCAGQLCSVFAACRELRTAPSDQAVRDALAALCPDPAPLEQRLNRLFAAQIPKGLRKRPQRVAIDLTLVPYHGQPHQRLGEIYRLLKKSLARKSEMAFNPASKYGFTVSMTNPETKPISSTISRYPMTNPTYEIKA
jgi:hypothetical protein